MTYESNGTKDIDIESGAPFLSSRIPDLLDRVQRAVIDHDGVQPIPPRRRQLNRLRAKAEVGHVPREHFHLLRVLVVQLVERRVRP